jgi:hypothetical protein
MGVNYEKQQDNAAIFFQIIESAIPPFLIQRIKAIKSIL